MKNKIKKVVDIVFKPFCFLFSFFVSIKISNFFKRQKYQIFSYHVKRKFSGCGKNFSLKTPFEIFGFKFIHCGNNVSLPTYTRIHVFDHFHEQNFNPKLDIGDNVIFNNNIHIACINKISIGDGTLVGSNVLITDHSHGDSSVDSLGLMPKDRLLESKGEINIGKNCWIGDNCVILSGVHLGENCIVGANSVVNKSFPANSLIVGSPAKMIKNIN